MQAGESWPLHGIALHTVDLSLRVMRESDLPGVLAVLPDDVELNPSATTYAGLDLAANRRAVVAQSYWRAFGSWSPDDWALPFVVRQQAHPGDQVAPIVGVQWLEGPDYRADRVVDSSSWVVADARGHGYGKQMRVAVLELAFSHLGAAAAVSSAVLSNVRSLGVSRGLGYRDTHTSVLPHSGETLRHVRLERDDWAASGLGDTVVVEGVAPALPYFELGYERD